MAIYIGHRQAGWQGLLVAGTSFIRPAVVIVTSFAWAYVRYGSIPEVRGVLDGVKPVIIAIVLQALWSLARAAIKTKFLAVVGITAVVVSFLGAHELLVLFGTGVVVGIARITWHQIESGRRFRSLISTVPRKITATLQELRVARLLEEHSGAPHSDYHVESYRNLSRGGTVDQLSCWL